MALDFIIENNKTYPREYLPLGTETHWEIYNSAKTKKMPLLGNINDYYLDYNFSTEQFDELLVEIKNLLKDSKNSIEADNFLIELKNLIISAKEQDKNIFVRAD
jgi:hypothetical protein